MLYIQAGLKAADVGAGEVGELRAAMLQAWTNEGTGQSVSLRTALVPTLSVIEHQTALTGS